MRKLLWNLESLRIILRASVRLMTKAYFDSHHPSYEASLYAGPAFKRGVLYKISADKDVPDPYRSSMSKGTYFK